MEKIKIGRIVNAVALRGEVKVDNYAGTKERYEKLDRIIAGDGKEYKIEKVRYQQEMVILKLAGIDDRNGAEAMKNKDVFITEDDLEELPCDTFYIKDLIGMDVTDAESGKKLGRLKDVLQPSSQDVYVVEREEGGDILIPAVSEFIKEVSLENHVISVKLIEGMAE